MKNYIPGLNGLRAIAVFLVILSHRLPVGHFFLQFPIGDYGVTLFFVLSGFLISRLLFFQIQNQSVNEISNFIILKKFILRRSLRIFPIYYLLLFFMYFTDGIIGNRFREHFSWYFFYAANYLNYTTDKWFGGLAHLWSLSVEEQFYLLWPVCLVFIFKNNLLRFLGFVILLGTVYPFFFDGNAEILTLSCVNAFGIGALLAYVEIIRPDWILFFNTSLKWLFVPVLAILLINNLIFKIPYFSERLAISILSVSLISFCRFHSKHFIVQQFLENRILEFVGLISYGIYLYHNILPKYWSWGLQQMEIKTPSSLGQFSYFEFVLQTLFLVFLSYLSWIIVEKPILKLKKYVAY
jgi:peptidoglycan/LPS O-acetylase OafA/YrhL